MYDTIHLWLPSSDIKTENYLKKVSDILDDATESYSHSKKESYFTGNVLGMRTSVSSSGISIKGSLCKSYLGNNFDSLTRNETQLAIEQIEDHLKLQISHAKLGRIDFANCIIVDYPPEHYYTFLGNCNTYKRFCQPKSLYYQNGLRTKLFYDKIKEAKSKRFFIPMKWVNKHVLRYELRFMSRLPKQFNKAQIQLMDLYNEDFYNDMVDRWLNEYEAINKYNTIIDKLNIENIKSPKDFMTQLALLQIRSEGLQSIIESVDLLKAKNVFQHKAYYSRLKSDIIELCQNGHMTVVNDLSNELGSKIREIMKSNLQIVSCNSKL